MDKDGGAHPKVKRRKLDGDTPAVTIASADDLHYLLTSRQSSTSGTRIAVLQFKDFLNSIVNSEHQEDRARKLRILGVYSEEQLPSGPQVAAFPDLISIWSFAVEINDERLLSSVPSVLALYLKIVSTQLQLRNIGLSLCKSLLLKDQLRLLDRGLTATKTKEHLISPCLRLLTEIVSFDGGEVAALIYSKKDTTFRRLEVFLGQRTQESDAPEDARQRPTLRRIAQRYLLANLKFQTASAKGEIIARGKILRACLQYLKYDQADIIRDVLVVLENDIVRTSSLTKGIKSRLFTYSNLSSLANLYTFHEPTATVSSSRSVRDQVDTLLRLICTQQDSGILLRQNGWYHAGSNPDKTLAVAADPTKIHPDLCPPSGSKHREKCPARNGTISTFILGLKPELDRLQASLLLDVFRAAPELVADYFSKRSNFIPEPKDTPAWLGQSAFLFSVIQLPVPTYCGWEDNYTSLPPPSSTVIESILPRPLDRPNITRCLNLNHEVITLFAVRAVTVAFQKLKKVLDVYRDATSNLESWKQGSSDLLSAFSQRCPLAKDVLSTLQRTPKSDEQLRGSVIELIANYHQVLPHLILLERFDTPLLLVDAIKRVGNDSEDQPLKSSRFSELENLMKIAQMSSDTNWWRKPDSSGHSAFTSMLKAILEADQSIPAIPSIRHLLGTIAAEHGVLVNDSDYFDVLVTSFTPENDWMPSDQTISFFDNCACRIAQQPVHYEDLVAEMTATDAAACLLPFAIAEQWPFVGAAKHQDNQKSIAGWITRFFVLLTGIGEDRSMIRELHKRIENATNDAALKKSLEKAYEKMSKETSAHLQPKGSERVNDESALRLASGAGKTRVALEEVFGPRMKEMETMEGLGRLIQEDVEVVVANGRLGQLCRSLSAIVEETRRQGFMTLQGMMKQIEQSTYSEKGTLLILVGELVETAKAARFARPMASIFTEFAAEAIEILNQPSHPMYGKINKFLQRGPSWNASKFVGYWAERIFLREPEDDNGHHHETSWFLSLLIQGLRDIEDMELYRRSSVFDRVLAFCTSILCSDTHRRQITELVYRSVKLGGGLTLISRMGIESWFAIEQANGKDQDTIEEMGTSLNDHVDTAAAQQWRTTNALRVDT